MDFNYPFNNNLHKQLYEKWNQNSFQSNSYEPGEEPEECSPLDCMCGIYDNTYDNYFYSHKQNPAQQYFAWIHLWKQLHLEIHQSCKELGTATHTDEYVRGYLDAVSYEHPINRITMEEDMKISNE
tara:strand:+ start:2057 stop:2434 length:378 start_codon:yes stop_codon:yes gene_type:complete